MKGECRGKPKSHFRFDYAEPHPIFYKISPYRCNLTIGFKSWDDPFYSLDIRSPDLLYITNENINPKDYEDKSYITYTITSLFTDTDYEFVAPKLRKECNLLEMSIG